MLVERWRRIESLFHEALTKNPAERASFLDEACPDDADLRREVESLLAHQTLAGDFLKSDRSEGKGATPSDPVPMGEEIGPYTILELLGVGGMGEVYRAHDQRLERDVAVKFLSLHMAGKAASLERFQREARAASALNHPNICTVHDVGVSQGRRYIVMELLEGQSLKSRIERGPLSIQEVTSIAGQVCAALRAAHDKGIVHRDLKPANIFINSAGQVKVLDFGLAKHGSEGSAIGFELGSPTQSLTLTAAGTILGTLAYMAPEQALGKDVGPRSDIFSLGVVLYEMAVGKRPFRGKTPAGILGSILTESPEKPSSISKAIPARLDRVILKALEKEPSKRYQSAAEVSADLAYWQEAANLRTRRWALAAVGTGVASLAGGAFLARHSLFPMDHRIRVAVLPFENIGGARRDQPVVSGLHQDMISVLNRLFPDQLAVIAYTSAKRYRRTKASVEQIAHDLKVDYVVEGEVQRQGPQIHITVRLIRVKDQAQIWNATFNRDFGEVGAAQSEAAQAIARGIEQGLRPDQQVSTVLARPLNPAAYEAYLRGEYAQAIKADPNYAAAYAGLADRIYFLGLFGLLPPEVAFPRMTKAASRAIDLDPTLAAAHKSLALSRLHQEWNWTAAEQSFQRALQLDPANAEVRHGYAHFLLWRGRRNESVRECDRAVALSPFDADLLACRGWHALYDNDYDKSIADALLALTYEPDDLWGKQVLGWAYEQKGMLQEGLASMRRIPDEYTISASSIAHVFARMGNRPAAEQILDRLLTSFRTWHAAPVLNEWPSAAELLQSVKPAYSSPYDIAVVYAGLGEHNQAFEWLQKAFAEHSSFMVYLSSDPRLMPLRREPAFQGLLRGMGLRSR